MAFRALGTFSYGVTNLVPGTPVGVVAGDILVAWLTVDTATSTITPPAGVGTWGLLSHPTQATPDAQSYWLYWRLATGSEPASETWVASGINSAAVISAWSGRANVAPTVSVVSQQLAAVANGTALTANSITPTSGADLGIFFGADSAFTGRSWNGVFSGAGYTDDGFISGGLGAYCGISISSKNAVAAGATGVVTGVLNEGQGALNTTGWSTLQIHLPAASAASTPTGWKKYLLAAGYFSSNFVNSAPLVLSNPIISGTPQVGISSGYTASSVSGYPTPTRTIQWTLDGANIGGATASTYTPVSGDAAHALRVVETWTNSSGSVVATSAPITVIAAGASSLALTWNLPVYKADGVTLSDATGVQYKIGTAPGAYGSPVTMAGGLVTSYTITGLVSGTTYYILLSTFNAAGDVNPIGYEISGVAP